MHFEGLILPTVLLCLHSFAAPVQDNQRLYKRSPVNLKGLAVGALASSAAIGQTDAFNGIPKSPSSASAVPGLKRFDQESMFSSPVESTNENVKLFAMEDPKPVVPVHPLQESDSSPVSSQAEEVLKDEFLSSIAIGNVAQVKDALDRGANVNWADSNGETALMIASFFGVTDVAKLLIERGANPNKVSDFRNTPLINAARQGSYNIAKLLIENGADVNKKNYAGQSALFIASFYGSLDIAELLIAADADLNARDNEGNTAALAAACSHDLEMIQLLASAGADMGIQNLDGNCPLIASSIFGDDTIVDHLIKSGAPLASKDVNGMNALDHAVKNARIKTAMKLFKAHKEQ